MMQAFLEVLEFVKVFTMTMHQNILPLHCWGSWNGENTSLKKYIYPEGVYIWSMYFFFLKLGFTPCKAEQPLKAWSYKKKKHKRIKADRKSV